MFLFILCSSLEAAILFQSSFFFQSLSSSDSGFYIRIHPLLLPGGDQFVRVILLLPEPYQFIFRFLCSYSSSSAPKDFVFCREYLVKYLFSLFPPRRRLLCSSDRLYFFFRKMYLLCTIFLNRQQPRGGRDGRWSCAARRQCHYEAEHLSRLVQVIVGSLMREGWLWWEVVSLIKEKEITLSCLISVGATGSVRTV